MVHAILTGMLKEKEIISIRDLLNERNLTIPPYQRPYRWSVSSVNTLFTDILDAMKKMYDLHLINYEYRLGTVVLHEDKDKNGALKLNIVDGQQRITTLILLLRCLGLGENEMPAPEYSKLSINNLLRNYNILKAAVNSLEDKNKYRDFILNNCTMVKIVITEQEEAFQFFDSQNSRGKELRPHDLLKAYHLREMNNLDRDIKTNIIRQWENNYREEDLEKFFYFTLYPLVRWYKGKSGLYFDVPKIKSFKGIKPDAGYNYAAYHKCVQAYLDEINKKCSSVKLSEYQLFQLTQPLLAGEHFFKYVFYYDRIASDVEKIIEKYNGSKHKEGILGFRLPCSGNGDMYTRELFKNILIFFADKFGTNCITEAVYKKFFCWCYYIRILMHAVYQETINNYATGNHDFNRETNIFEVINEMNNPKEVNSLYVQKTENFKSNELIYQKIKEYSGWNYECR